MAYDEGLLERVADRSVPKLIRMWLNAPVREEPKGKPPTQKRSRKGTPQGGVIRDVIDPPCGL